MNTVGKLQAKLAELLQINEAAVTHIENLVAERDYFKNGMAELQDIIDKLEPERDALVAENAIFRSLLKMAQDEFIEAHSDGEMDCVTPYDVYHAGPTQCLNEIRAEAGRAGYLQGYTDALNVQSSNLGQILADEYALLVKAGEV